MEKQNADTAQWWHVLLVGTILLSPMFAWDWGFVIPLFLLMTGKWSDKHKAFSFLWIAVSVVAPFFAIQSLVVAAFGVVGWFSWFESVIYLALMGVLFYDVRQRRKAAKPG